MSVQIELIGQLLVRYGTKKEAAIAAGLSLSRFSNYFHDHRKMDDEAVIGCAEALGLDPAPLVYKHNAEIATSERALSFWRKAAGSSLALLAMLVVLGATTLPGVGMQDAQAGAKGAQTGTQSVQAMHYAKFR